MNENKRWAQARLDWEAALSDARATDRQHAAYATALENPFRADLRFARARLREAFEALVLLRRDASAYHTEGWITRRLPTELYLVPGGLAARNLGVAL